VKLLIILFSNLKFGNEDYKRCVFCFSIIIWWQIVFDASKVFPSHNLVYSHPGEVYVLNDGGEVDLDLGNYERFLDVTLAKDNNITTGKIYSQVIKRERKGDYLGKTVQGKRNIKLNKGHYHDIVWYHKNMILFEISKTLWHFETILYTRNSKVNLHAAYVL